MKEVHKKSMDAAVNRMLISAYRSKTSLIWDRAEAIQPQCGFGRLAICCSDCQDGPCRTNPFAETVQQTICGRDQQALLMTRFVQKASDGMASLAKLAEQDGVAVDTKAMWQLLTVDDEMVDAADLAERLCRIGRFVDALLEKFCIERREEGSWKPSAAGVNLGVLQPDAVNIVLHGHVIRQVVAGLQAAAAREQIEVNLAGMCGNELSGTLHLPAVANYPSQEIPLLTGLVDLLVTGSQCVMPSLRQLADRQGVVLRTTPETMEEDCRKAILDAWQASKRRKIGNQVEAAYDAGSAWGGYTTDNSPDLFQTLIHQYREGRLRGAVYLGGCGAVSNTLDEQPVRLAGALIEAGYLVLAAGCAGTALARAGLCRPDWLGSNHALGGSLPPDTPPVLQLGSCRDAGEYLRIAAILQQGGVPVAAVFPEIIHNKILATAAGFAAAGIPSWLRDETLPAGIGSPEFPLLPFADLPEFLARLKERVK